jgi:serine/threonine protein kinase/formylglycine-generating enzyme required for sulfatase activity
MRALECPNDEKLAAFAVGDLRERDFDAVSRHIESCAPCESRLDTLDHVTDALVGALRGSSDSRNGAASASGSTATRRSGNAGRLAALPAGTVLGDYMIEGALGEGGMGQVYKAVHQRMNRVVAVKIVSPKAVGSPEAVARFRREIEVVARLAHPNVATAFDAREHDGTHYLVLEYVSGRDLAQVVKREGPLEARRAAGYILQAARGLAHAHRLGVIHRDVKPANLMLDDTGTIKVLDLGLARLGGDESAPEATTTLADTTVAARDLTVAGTVMGTYSFMAPEQAANPHAADARADIYSLGCTLYFLLVGKPPRDGRLGGARTRVELDASGRAPSVRDAGVAAPPALDSVMRRMMANRPSDRFASMEQVVRVLEPIATPTAASRRRWAMAAAAVVVVAVAYLAFRPPASSAITSAEEQATSRPVAPELPIAPFSADEAKRCQAEWATYHQAPGELSNTLGMKFALIPPGEFRLYGKFPVRLTRAYYLGTHEVTVGHFREFANDARHRTDAEINGGMVHPDWNKADLAPRKDSNWRSPGLPGTPRDDHPVVQISWTDADQFCRWLSAKEQRVYRLPTQAEWEWGARAGSAGKYHFGDDRSKLAEYEWFAENSGFTVHPVGSRRPNAWRLFDVLGNASELTMDATYIKFNAGELVLDPAAGRPDGYRISRGGSFYNAPRDVEINKSGYVGERLSMWGFGFRVLRELPASTAK